MYFLPKVVVMYKAIACLVAVIILSSAGLTATKMQPPVDKRIQAKKLLDENNIDDALQLYRGTEFQRTWDLPSLASIISG